TDYDDISARAFLPPGFHPQVEYVVQVDICQQGRDHRALWRTHLRFRPYTVLGNSGLQPFLDQPKYSSVGNAMLEKTHRPFVVHVVKEPTDVSIQHPVHLLSLDPNRQRIQRLMLASFRSRAIRKAPKIHLVNLIKNGDHGVLNDLVLQRRNAQRPFPAVGFRNIHSPRWLRSIGASANPAVKILEAIFLPGLVLLPRQTIYSWGSLPLQRVETVPKQTGRDMVKQSSEL